MAGTHVVPPMKIIFLDIDGVINNRASMKRHSETKTIYNLDPPCIAQLNILCRDSGAYCVVSSTWRRGWPVAALWQLMKAHGFLGYVIDRTDYLSGQERGVEIAAYLTQCRERGYPVESFVILDDDSDMGPLKPYLVQTRSADGLQAEHVAAALKILEEDPCANPDS